MVHRVPLNNVDHHALRVIATHSATYGDSVNQVLVVPNEFEDVQREYPIFFRLDPEGSYYAVALLGLDKGENLFLCNSGWDARYVPAVQRRGPFFIGSADEEIDGEVRREPKIYIDLDDPRVGEAEGEPLFLPHGGNSPYLEHVGRALQTVHHGLEIGAAMFAMFTELELIEPVQVEIQLGDGKQYNLPNLHTIGQERLASLNAAGLYRLHRAGFISAAFLVRSSLGNVHRLIEMKTKKGDG